MQKRSGNVCTREGNYTAIYDVTNRTDDIKTWVPIGIDFPRIAGVNITWVFVDADKSTSQVILYKDF